MKNFVALFEELDSTTSTLEKTEALKKYFSRAVPLDAMWAILILTGRIKKRSMTGRDLRDIFLFKTQYPEWLFVESYSQVGDSAETIALLVHSLGLCGQSISETDISDYSLTNWMEKYIPELAKLKDISAQSDLLFSWYANLSMEEVFILGKLMTGAFRVGVSEKIVVRALAEAYSIATDQVAHRLTGITDASAESFQNLISTAETHRAFSQPYPFCLAHPFLERKGDPWNPAEWCLEWKFDGIRAQVIHREGQIYIWSRGEENITASFPDLQKQFLNLPEGVVVDGEVLIIKKGQIQTFASLQKRLGRKKVSELVLKEFPAGFIAYDCLEFHGKDLRPLPLRGRKQYLDKAMKPVLNEQIKISEVFSVNNLKALEALREEARLHHSEGLMVKLWDGPYTVGRKTGNWWKYKIDPMTLDAVLIYAQAGSGRRANLFTDYTFALWKEDQLVPFAKAYSGLDQEEINELDAWIRRHTKEKFGPVRSLEAFHVFEIGFEGIAKSTRHKSGIAVRFPRILRWRRDKKAVDADQLDTAFELLQSTEEAAS